MQGQVCICSFTSVCRIWLHCIHKQKLRESLICHACQGGQLELDQSPDTEAEGQGSMPSSVSVLLSGLPAFGAP